MEATDVLWGGQLKAVALDPVDHRLELQVEVLEAGVATTYDLMCSGVSEVRFSNSIPEPWSYAEVTEVHSIQTTSGQRRLEIMLWSEDCELVCTCDEISVTERP